LHHASTETSLDNKILLQCSLCFKIIVVRITNLAYFLTKNYPNDNFQKGEYND
jgi:hypothetical protein